MSNQSTAISENQIQITERTPITFRQIPNFRGVSYSFIMNNKQFIKHNQPSGKNGKCWTTLEDFDNFILNRS